MKWKFWEKPIPAPPVPKTPENPPAFLDDKRTYVCHGETEWGNSITQSSTDHDHIYVVAGWLQTAPFPRVGDELLMAMSKGGWGSYVFAEVRIHRDPNDMFTGKVFGAYGLSDLEPKTKNCDEFIDSGHNLQFFRT